MNVENGNISSENAEDSIESDYPNISLLQKNSGNPHSSEFHHCDIISQSLHSFRRWTANSDIPNISRHDSRARSCLPGRTEWFVDSYCMGG